MAIQSVAMDSGDVGIYGLLSGFRGARVDPDKGEMRVFTDMSAERLGAAAKRADNVIDGASGVLHTIGDLLIAHDSSVDKVHSIDVGAAVTMLVDLLDGARLIASDARSELELRNRSEAAS